jgi:hypothetical protein
MACVTGNTINYNVRDLPEVFAIENGNLIIVETDEGTNILDYENFIIDLDHTTFGSTITQNVLDTFALSSKSSSWDSTYTTVNLLSDAWLSVGSGGTYSNASELPAGPSFSHLTFKKTLILAGNATAKNTPPQDVSGLQTNIILSDPSSYLKIDVGISTTNHKTAANYQAAFTILTAEATGETITGSWGELVQYTKTDGVYESLNGIFCTNGTNNNFPDISYTGTSLTFAPGVSALGVKIGYRLEAGKSIRINGSSPQNNTNSTDDGNGVSYINLQEIPNYGFTKIQVV